MVNGALTSQIPIRRSIRQGCPLSMFLYAITLEPFIYNINNNHQINGIKIPNFRLPVKSLQHADDTSIFISTVSSYGYIKKEDARFENASGSKVNEQKCEILLLGKWKYQITDLPPNHIKDNIKLFRIKFGKMQLMKTIKTRF